MAWNLNSDRPIFIQIVERIEMDIISGKYKPGDKLPSVRDFAAEAAVNPNRSCFLTADNRTIYYGGHFHDR